MNKNNRLKNQIFVSIGIAVLIIICSGFYLFTSLTKFSDNNKAISYHVQDQLKASSSLNYSLFKLVDSKISDVVLSQDESFIDQSFITQIRKDIGVLKDLARSENTKNGKFIVHAQSIVDLISHNGTLKDPTNDPIAYWLNIQDDIVLEYTAYISHLIDDRNVQLLENEREFNDIKYTTLILIFLCLSVIIYAIYKFYYVIHYLQATTADLKRINHEFEEAKVDIENTNWILEQNTLLTDNIRGHDDTKLIAALTLKILNENLPVQAATMYIRKPNTDIFELFEKIGVNEDRVLRNFIIEEGFLGKLVEDKKVLFKKYDSVHHLETFSSLISRFPTIVFFCPLVHDNYALGLLEIALHVDSESDIKKFHNYFIRISNTVAGKIKFGQSHVLVEKLLQETNRQKEELEQQQEELRITNEELIYKTNLLETSEEELSVQQEELSQTNIELTQKAIELEKRNSELNSTQKIVEQKILEVEQASKYKSEFMANMSHELRTPLNSILILAKLLQDNKSQNLSAEQIKYANVIHTSGSDLLALINELLDLAKIESGKVEIEPVNINSHSFSIQVNELFSALAKDKGVNFQTIVEPSMPVEFISDEYRLQQVIKNFLSNAFKFTESGGKVCLSIREQENNLYFEVSDTGKGISKEKQELIFEAFTQEDGSTSRKYGGTGLGLSISREIASLLGGRIVLESELGQGSTFTLILPKSSYQSQVKPTSVVSKQILDVDNHSQGNFSDLDSKIKSILIIEDDINFADILKNFAEEYGYIVNLAHDGEAGIKLAKELVPDAIILDVMLPICDGWTVLRSLKDDLSTQHIPVHMMSAANFNRKDFIEQGAIGFLKKPVTEKNIQEIFENINLNLNQFVKKILLVEDQEFQSDFVKKAFYEKNINVIQAFTLHSALEKLSNEKNIDCIILDVQLPDGSGLDLIEKIKINPEFSNIPIVINTASDLTKEQYERFVKEAKLTILKSEKSIERLIDEVNLFFNKIETESLHNVSHLEIIQSESNLKGKKVLIADDDMRNIFALSTSLHEYGMEIDIASNGKEVIRILENKENKIDIILMDVMMPEMDGYEAIRYIRKDLRISKLPIIAVTAKAMKGDREKSIQIGASDYVSKPIDLEKLVSLMQVWLS